MKVKKKKINVDFYLQKLKAQLLSFALLLSFKNKNFI